MNNSINHFKYLLSNYKKNSLSLKNRIVLAPMTRCLSNDNQIPSENMYHFYRKRASCGLLITEATCITPNANAYPNTPGIFSDPQISVWHSISKIVKNQGAKFFMQLWHPGMMAHSSCSNGSHPLSPSGIKPLKTLVPRLKIPYEIPKVMNKNDFFIVKNQFRQAAFNAINKAYFDGIELHAASGYLLDSFLHYSTNRRTDNYGGNPENMSRFLLELIHDIMQIIEPSKIGIRISPIPLPSMQSLAESQEDSTVFCYLLKKLECLNLAYIHVASDNDETDRGSLLTKVSTFVRNNYKGTLIAGGNYCIHKAEEALKNKEFDLIYFGRLLIANPNLIHILQKSDFENLTEFTSNMITQAP